MDLSTEELEQWAAEANRHNVRVKYRIEGQEQPTTRTMAYVEFQRWAREASANGYALISADMERKR